MTIGSTEFDGDSHTRKADWFGMTVLFGACVHLYKFQFVGPQNDTERVRLGAITDHARHDLAARPAGKFQFVFLLRKANTVNHPFFQSEAKQYFNCQFFSLRFCTKLQKTAEKPGKIPLVF